MVYYFTILFRKKRIRKKTFILKNVKKCHFEIGYLQIYHNIFISAEMSISPKCKIKVNIHYEYKNI